MSEMVRYSLNTLTEANEYAAQKRAQGCKEVSVKPLYHKDEQVGYSVFWKKETN